MPQRHEIDPDYAAAWALMAVSQAALRFHFSEPGDGGLAAAERALSIDANLAEAHAAIARVLTSNSKYDEAQREIETALRLDPESFEVNTAAARLTTRRVAMKTPRAITRKPRRSWSPTFPPWRC